MRSTDRYRMRKVLVVFLLILSWSAAHAGHDGNRNSGTVVSCLPDPANAHQPVTCTATVSDLYGVPGQREAPTGSVTFSVTTGPGSLSPASCALAPTGTTGVSSCSVTYTPTAGGIHSIAADYGGGVGSGFVGGWLPSNGNTTITVNNPVPTITSINPVFGLRGDTLNVTVSGSNFVSTGMTADFGAGITTNSITWVDSTTLTVNISIAIGTTTGLRSVTVTNPAPAGGSATLTNAFEVRNPLPVISDLVPASAEVGSGALVVTINGSGFVTDSIARFNGAARATAFINSTQLQMSLLAGDTAVVGDYPVTVVNAAPGGGTSNAATFSVVLSGGSFTTVENGASLASNMFTKLAGTPFSFDILATDVSRTSINTAFTGTVKLELLDATDDSGALDANGCRNSWVVAQTLPDQVFAGGDNGRIAVNTTYNNALRIARFRISSPAVGTPTLVGCSADAFSIRPTMLTLSSTLNNGAATPTGTPIHSAGATFSMSATAIPGYTGTPQFVDDTPPNNVGTVAGSFNAANPGTGVSSGNTFTYSDVGRFRYDISELRDTTFTAVDQPNDCTSGADAFSNSLIGDKYGCSFGNTATTQWVGRFVPAYFDVEISQQGCDADNFTYSAQPFEVTVTARNDSGGVTQNYTSGAFARDVTLSDAGDTANFSGNAISSLDFNSGTVVYPDVVYTFADPESSFETIDVRAADPDSVSSAGHLEESTEIRSGRLVLGNPSAITLQDALMSVELEAWQETSPGVDEWAVHAADTSCTTLALVDFSFDAASYTGGLAAGETTLSGFFFNAGQGALTLSAPGPGNSGSVDVEVDTDSWLHFDWSGGGVESPVGTVSFFEIFETEEGLIDRREVIQ